MAADLSAIKLIFSQQFWRMAVLWTFSLLYSYFQLFFPSLFRSLSSPYPRCRFSPDPDSKIKRPICVVTGATSGLGAAAARALAADGYHVILVGRSWQLLDQRIDEIKQKHRDAYVNAFQVDLASIHSILEFGSSLKQWLVDNNLHCSIQLLVNNAGILATSSRVTADGFDQMIETNYISAFILTNLLLPLLKNSPVPSRIVNVTSFTHRSVSLLLFTYELHRQLNAMDSSSNISVNAVDPGAVETNIMRELPQCLSQLAFTVLRCLCLLQSPEDGAGSILDAALAPPEISGKYFFGGKGRTMRSSSLSYNAKLAKDLWSASNVLFQGSPQTKS